MSDIGAWIRRPKGRWHLTESIVAGASITHCGRRLEPRADDQLSAVEPLTRMIGQPQLCKRCA